MLYSMAKVFKLYTPYALIVRGYYSSTKQWAASIIIFRKFLHAIYNWCSLFFSYYNKVFIWVKEAQVT